MVTFTVLEETELDESLTKLIGMSRGLAGVRKHRPPPRGRE